MSATASSQPLPAHRLPPRRGAATWLAGASAVSLLFSIAAAELFLFAALLWLLIARTPPLRLPRGLRLPLCGFVIWTLLAIAFSFSPGGGAATGPDAAAAIATLKKLLLLLTLAAGCTVFRDRRSVRLAAAGICAAATVGALYGLAQFAWRFVSIQRRGAPFYESYITHQITGFMGHWMTFAGQLMLAALLLVSLLLFGDGRARARWGWLAFAFIIAAILAAFTRGIWIGTAVGLTYLFGAYRRAMLCVVPCTILALWLLAPSWLQRREQSIFEPAEDTSSMSRLLMLRTGLRMVAAHPLFGVGPERVASQFPRYRPPAAPVPPAWYGHLHDSFLQIAAERGLPCLAFFLWFLGAVLWENFRAAAAVARDRPFAHAAVAATLGMMVAGLFEYNFGDSEVLILFLFVISLAYAWREAPAQEGAHG